MPIMLSLLLWIKKMLRPNEENFRDSMIIRFGSDDDIRSGKQQGGIAAYLSSQQVSLTDSIENRYVESPMILLEGDRESIGIEDYYIYPPHLGNPIPLSLYIPKWAGFARLLLSSKIVQGMRQADYAYALLQRAIDHCRRINGIAQARKLVQALHDTRWSTGPEMTAGLFTVATRDHSTAESVSNMGNNDHQFLSNEISALRKQLMHAKDACQNLTQWCEALYSINPGIWAILGYLRESDLPEADKWYRYFAEIDADIASCSIRNIFSVIHSEMGESGASWEHLFLSERQASGDQKEFKQRMQSLLHMRTCIPTFWYNAAIQSFQTDKENLPNGLKFVDKWRAVSVDILRASSKKWLASR